MNKLNVLDVMRVGPVIPVLVIEDLAQAVPLAKALVAGGVRVLEVTLRTLRPSRSLPPVRRGLPIVVVPPCWCSRSWSLDSCC